MDSLAYIPSPSTGVLHLGPVPLRGYAFCIIIGVFAAVWIGNRRWIARGGKAGTVADIAVWAVPFGLLGGRLYHVVTDYQLYFSEGRDWVDAFKIWEGGLGIWGAISLGAVGAWIGCRRRGIALPAYADAIAPGIAVAQAVGRWGNWFNQELYGRPTDLPWALKITDAGNRVGGTYHPTFLYESLWCIGVALLVIWADRRFGLGHGRAFALYVASYCVGRGWIEYMRVDEAHHILGVRLNVWTSVIVFLLAVSYMIISSRMRPGREETVEPAAVAKATGPGGDDSSAKDGKDGSEKSESESEESEPESAKGGAEKAAAPGEDDTSASAKDETPSEAEAGAGADGDKDAPEDALTADQTPAGVPEEAPEEASADAAKGSTAPTDTTEEPEAVSKKG